MTAEARIASIAAKYDDERGTLIAGALARREWRLKRGGHECSRCRETKPISAFSQDAREKSGLRRYCRECAARADRLRAPDPTPTEREQ